MLNNCNFIGRLTRDPELRRTSTDTPVCSFTLAVDRSSLENGERKTDFIDCVAWRKNAELICQYVHKGYLFNVTGSLQMRDWTDKEGNKRRNAEILVKEFTFLEPKKEKSEEDFSQIPAYGTNFSQLNDRDEGLPF